MANFEEQLREPYSLNGEQIDFYRKNGFIKLKQVLSPDLIEYYKRVITEAVKEKNQMIGKPMEERSTYEKAFIQITNLWRDNTAIKQLVLSERLGKIAAGLMRVEGVRLYHDQALYKEPAGSADNITPWHADQYYWPLDTDNTVTAWIPLQQTTNDMGPLAFSVGSHKFEFGRDMEISDESEEKIQAALKAENLDFAESGFDLGEVSFHSGWTFHRAGPNRTDEVRAAMTVIYMEDGVKVSELKREEHHADRDAFLPGLQPGDVAVTELNPLIYHRSGSSDS